MTDKEFVYAVNNAVETTSLMEKYELYLSRICPSDIEGQYYPGMGFTCKCSEDLDDPGDLFTAYKLMVKDGAVVIEGFIRDMPVPDDTGLVLACTKRGPLFYWSPKDKGRYVVTGEDVVPHLASLGIDCIEQFG